MWNLRFRKKICTVKSTIRLDSDITQMDHAAIRQWHEITIINMVKAMVDKIANVRAHR